VSGDLVDAVAYALRVGGDAPTGDDVYVAVDLLLGALPPAEQSIARLGGSLEGSGLGVVWGAGRRKPDPSNTLPNPADNPPLYDARIVRYSHPKERTLGHIRNAPRRTAQSINKAAKVLGLHVCGAVRQ
jgi:hypothetical protein